MQIGIVGLGKMGGNMAQRLHRGGVEVVGFDRNDQARQALAEQAIPAVSSLEMLIGGLSSPRLIWVMLPAGEATEQTLRLLADQLSAGDIVIDGGNANYKDSVRRHRLLGERGVRFVDAGVSGGVWGLEEGYALMLGGNADAIEVAAPVFRVLAPAADRGWLHCGPPGAGHFTKMIHNGIEYGMMQAYAEGFALLKNKQEFAIDIAAVAEVWRHGSVIRSWLLDLMAAALEQDQELQDVEAYVADSGEGRWTAVEAIEQGVPAPVIAAALAMRFTSQGAQDYASKLLAVTRKQFGGHEVRRR